MQSKRPWVDVESERRWERLIAYLNTWAEAREEGDRIAITSRSRDGADQTVQIVMTPDDWMDYTSTTYGTDDPAKTDIKAMILVAPAEARFLVYRKYDLHPSDSPTLPPFPDLNASRLSGGVEVAESPPPS